MELDKDFREYTAANELDGTDIGMNVQFDWKFPSSDVNAKVEGQIRDIYHRTGITVLNLSAINVSNTETTEFILDPYTNVYYTG